MRKSFITEHFFKKIIITISTYQYLKVWQKLYFTYEIVVYLVTWKILEPSFGLAYRFSVY